MSDKMPSRGFHGAVLKLLRAGDYQVLGSNFTLPEPAPKGYVIVGDTASLPAINSQLTTIGDAPARVFLEAGHDDDKQLPVARSADVVWVDRKNSGEALVQAVGVRRRRPLRLGGVRQPNHPRGGQDLPRGVLHPAQVDQGASVLGDLTGHGASWSAPAGSAAQSARRTHRALPARRRRRVPGTGTVRSSPAPASGPGAPPTWGRRVPAR